MAALASPGKADSPGGALLATPARLGIVALLLGVSLLAGVRPAHAINACTAAQLNANDPGCPAGTGPCTITRVFDVGNGCVLDFGARDVTLAASGEINMAANAVTIRARSVTVAPASLIDGRGVGATPQGGLLRLETTGNVTVQQTGTTSGRIDVSGNGRAGEIRIVAQGSITVDGRLEADALTATAPGGIIALDAGGDITSSAGSALSAQGGTGGVGEITLIAEGRIAMGDLLDLRGPEGGVVDIAAGGEVVLDDIQARATAAEGSGGIIDVFAGTQARLLGAISLDGYSGTVAGGYGGTLTVDALAGDVTVAASISVNGAPPDGSGGDIAYTAAGTVSIQTATMTTARGAGLGDGGIVEIDAGVDTLLNGQIDVTAGAGGGEISVLANRHITVNGQQAAPGTAAGGYGGSVLMEAGIFTGSLTINAFVDVSGGGCNDLGGCGFGGATDLAGCDVTVTASGRLDARGGDGGENYLQAREQLTITGAVLATPLSATGFDGTNFLVYPSRKPAATAPGQVSPAPVTIAAPTCIAQGIPANCLVPCPVCGNGLLEYPETCDQLGTPQNCDGCSRFCALENCDDSNPCTSSSCDPAFGCRLSALPDGTSCADLSVCNGAEHCTNGTCGGGTPLDCSDANPCTLDTTCNPLTGCVVPHPPAPPGTACNDNNLCTALDSCVLGTCTGQTVSCDDGRECTTEACSPQTGCSNPPRSGACTDDGNSCTADVCNAGNCTHPGRPDGTPCDDGAFCTLNDGCVGGSCAGGPPRTCADTDVCTQDSCNETLDICVNTPISGCCGDGLPDPGEDCDDGNTSNTDGCLNTCRVASCGDGFVRAGVEACDLGGGNSDAPDAACRTDCRATRCGDGITDPGRSEQCDDGNTAGGDTCSPECYIAPPATADLIAGGRSPRDCALEVAMDRPLLDKRGAPSFRQTCRDGDTCDRGSQPGECVFHLWLCVNDRDARLPACTPGPAGIGTVAGVQVAGPSANDAAKRPEDAANRAELQNGASVAPGRGLDFCGPRRAIRVPLRSAKAGRKNVRHRATLATNRKDNDLLKLTCVP